MASTDVVRRTEPLRAVGIVALTLGLLSFTTFALWWLALPLAIAGGALGLMVRRRNPSHILGRAAIVVGVAALLVAIVVAVALTPAVVASG